MKKRVVTLLLAFMIASGSIAPASTAYAAEYSANEEALALVSSEEEDATDASGKASTETSKEPREENSEENTDTEKNSDSDKSGETDPGDGEADENDNHQSEDKTGEQEKDTENTSKENNSSEKEESMGDTFENETAQDSASEADTSENAASQETADDAAEEEAGDEATLEESLDEEDDDAAAEDSAEELIIEEDEAKLVEYTFKTNCYDTQTKVATDENGKVITGWINVDVPAEEGATAYEIKAVGTKALSRTEGVVYYISPETKTAVSGVNKIGGKRYLFYQTGIGNDKKACQLARGNDKKTEVRSGNTAFYCVLPSGEICTGWQVIGDNEYHYNETLGCKDTMVWIARGKGCTYVDSNGRMLDSYNHSLNEDGLHYIYDGQYTTPGRADEFYVFKGGVRLTGIVYFDAEDKLTTAAKAVYARYCDLGTGIVKSGFFTVGSKLYYAGPETFPTVSKEGDLATARTYGRMTLNSVTRLSDSGSLVFIDKTGALAVNKLVTFEGKTYYAKADGMLCVNEYFMVNGKLCHFNAGGEMDNSAVRLTDYKCSEDGSNVSSTAKVYANGKDSLLFYSDIKCTQVIKNCWLMNNSGSAARVYYLDKSGRAVKGVVTINKKKYAFDPSTGKCLNALEGNNGGPIKISGKYYFVSSEGEVVSKVGFIGDGKKYYYVKSTSGQLATGLTTIRGKRYYFDSDASQVVGPIVIGSKRYITNPMGEDGGEQGYILSKKDFLALAAVMVPEEAGMAEIMVNMNSDGSFKTGWKTVHGKKYYFFEGVNVGLDSTSDETDFVSINGTMYSFDPTDGAMEKNKFVELKKSDRFTIHFYSGSAFSSASTFARQNTAVYFGSNGAAVTGFATVNGVKHYFYPEDNTFINIYKGMMATDTTLTIKGKIYRFDENGMIDSSENEDYHYNKDGSLVTGKTVVKNTAGTKSYYHDPKTGKLERRVIRKTGSKWYLYGSDGIMRTSDLFYSSDKSYTVKVNAKDGSITGFYSTENGTDKKITGSAIIYEGSYYFLGSNGLPVTGLYKLSESDSMDFCDNKPGCSMYIESDGYCAYKPGRNSTDCSMIKVGSKIYLINNGHTVTALDEKGHPVMYSVLDYSSLPSADRANVDMYALQSSSSRKFVAAVREDGSVGAFTYTDPSFTRSREYFNKYGISIRQMGTFARVGNSFYVIGDVSSASSETLKASDQNGNNVTLEFSWDNNLKVGKFREVETGKPANGGYILDYSRRPVMVFKNGVIQTGKQTVKTSYGSSAVYINPDTGWYRSY
ncbi:MAG: hypothetical protein K6C96_12445 [Butyrivibrio sp.]|nr:hypothetical protein [Butyrivibrio sp.]